MPPPSLLTTTIVSCGNGSSGPTTSPLLSCRNVRSPMSAKAGPPPSRCQASAAPIAVETVPSMPDAPRFAMTVTPSRGAAYWRSRTASEEPATSNAFCGNAAYRVDAIAGPDQPVRSRLCDQRSVGGLPLLQEAQIWLHVPVLDGELPVHDPSTVTGIGPPGSRGRPPLRRSQGRGATLGRRA